MEAENKSRRQFLRNTVLATLAAGIAPETVLSATAVSADPQACNPTTLDYYGQGPFYTPNAPVISNGQLAASSEPGTRLILSGIIKTLDCSAVLPNTELDIWHATDAGTYDTSGFNLRGKTTTNSQGFYLFETILPGKYLNGGTYRPSHIHFRITPPGHPTLVTQLYFQGDTSIPGDAAASQTSGTFDATHRIIPITLNSQGKYEGTWDIAISGDGSVGSPDLHLDKGMVYSVTPNPFAGDVEIRYGVFRNSRVAIQVVDLQGRLVAELDEKELAPQKYTAVWSAKNMPSGVYFVVLRLNDLQVHYLRVIRE